MPAHAPDFRLDGYQAATKTVDDRFWQHIMIRELDFYTLAQHHTVDGQHGYFVLHDQSAQWGIPGEAQIVALHLQRDVQARVFRFQHLVLPLVPMAQSWLIARGCPEEAIVLPPISAGSTPADETTRALERRLMSDGDNFALLHSYTDDSSAKSQTVVVLRALDEGSAVPFRVLLEEADLDSGNHTLREGAFADLDSVSNWWEDHFSGHEPPLPPPPAPAGPTTSPGLPPRPAPTAASPRGR